MSRPLIRSGQWSQTTTGILQPAARFRSISRKLEMRSDQAMAINGFYTFSSARKKNDCGPKSFSK